MHKYGLYASVLALACASFILAQDKGGGKGAPGKGGKAAPKQMSFFVTSTGKGDGANYGGILGADQHCQNLAAAAGAGNLTWRAYLSTQGPNAVNARDRIGPGPWYNAKGNLVATNLGMLHGDTLEEARMGNILTKVTAVDEKGNAIKGFGDTPNQHDILTGSTPDGKAYTDGAQHTCNNWSSNAATGDAAQVGHFDRTGGANGSWNSTHASRGCSQDALAASGGAGLLYCFALPPQQ